MRSPTAPDGPRRAGAGSAAPGSATTAAVPLLEVADLSVEFTLRAGTLRAVRGLSYTIGAGESLGLVDGGSHGMSLPLLRETRMPAVICEISPAAVLVEQAPSVARAVVTALAEWAATAWD